MNQGKRLHIIGICGTFMGGVAQLAAAAGYRVSGSDKAFYPPMGEQLRAAGVLCFEGYSADHIDEAIDTVVIGNALSRGNPEVEAVLNRGLPYTSGAEWLARDYLRHRHVLAVAGTHGKTTTSSLLAWILDYAGLAPGFLIGGVPDNFACSARAGAGQYFVVEADEYDTAFFDKRSKFVHYRPKTLVLNNLEFDHADIFENLEAIKRQFHHLLRTVPSSGACVISNADDEALNDVLSRGLWTPCRRFGVLSGDARVWVGDDGQGEVSIDGQRYLLPATIVGLHNASNALAAMLAAAEVGVEPAQAIEALSAFAGVKRRLEHRGTVAGVSVYDDFAHHPTAVSMTLQAAKARLAGPLERVVAVIELRSNSMRMGTHTAELGPALDLADAVYVYIPSDVNCDLRPLLQGIDNQKVSVTRHIEVLVATVVNQSRAGDHVVVMSNGPFDAVHEKLLSELSP